MDRSRRTFLTRSVALATIGVTGAIALVRTTGYDVDYRRRAYLKALSGWQLAVVDALADRVCAADVPYDQPFAPPTPRECEVAEFVDAYAAAAEPAVRSDLLAAIGAIEHVFPLLYGHVHRFTALSPSAQDQVLASMERSSSSLIRGAFNGLKACLMMGYWRDPRTWGAIGYDGPRVNRPAGGWVPLRYRP
ncbi:MAG: gluconate 2-dehydrogenase subunit 3 family protein [Polyangiales bacterium]